MQSQFIIYLAVLALYWTQLTSAGPQEDEAERKLYGQLYYERDAKEPEVTLQLLMDICKVYKQKGDKKNYDYTIHLVDYSEFNREKCRQYHFDDLNKEIEKRSWSLEDRTNIVPYLEWCRKKQFAFCERSINSFVKETVEKFTPDLKEKFNLLKAELVKAGYRESQENPMARIDTLVLVNGLKSYFKHVLKVKKSDISRENFVAHGMLMVRLQRVDRICYKLIKHLGPATFTLKMKPSLVKDLDEFALEWVNNTNLCASLKEDRVYDQLCESIDKPLWFKLKNGLQSLAKDKRVISKCCSSTQVA